MYVIPFGIYLYAIPILRRMKNGGVSERGIHIYNPIPIYNVILLTYLPTIQPTYQTNHKKYIYYYYDFMMNTEIDIL